MKYEKPVAEVIDFDVKEDIMEITFGSQAIEGGDNWDNDDW